MKTLRRAGVLATLLCCCALAWARVGPPQVDGFDVEEVPALGEGTSLHFTLYGTPGGAARLHIDGAARPLVLAETTPGVYEGRYLIGSDDRVAPDSHVDAELRLAGEVVSASLEEPLVLGASPSPDITLTQAPTPAPRPVEPVMATPVPMVPVAPPPAAEPRCDDCGVVQAIRPVERPGSAGYAGAITGGVLGAIVGDKVGRGEGRRFARILGALGGAFAGREIERANTRRTSYEVALRLDSGEQRMLHFEGPPPVKVGDRVRLARGGVQRDMVPIQR